MLLRTFENVLGLARIERIFFRAAREVPCFVTTTALTTHERSGECRSVLAQHQGCLFFLLLLLCWAKSWEGHKLPSWDIPHRRMSHSATGAEGGLEGGGGAIITGLLVGGNE